MSSAPSCLQTLITAFEQARLPVGLANLSVIADAMETPLSDPREVDDVGPHDSRLAGDVARAIATLPVLPEAQRTPVFMRLLDQALATHKVAVVAALWGSHLAPAGGTPLPGIQERLLRTQLSDPYWLDRLPPMLFRRLVGARDRDPVPVSDATWQAVWERGGPLALDNAQQLTEVVSQAQWKAWFDRQPLPGLIASALASVIDGRPVVRFPKKHIANEQQEQLLTHPHAPHAASAVFDWFATADLPSVGTRGLDAPVLRGWAIRAAIRLSPAERLGHPGVQAWRAWLAAPFEPAASVGQPVKVLVDHWFSVMDWDSIFIGEGAGEAPALFSGRHLPALLDLVAVRSQDAAGKAVTAICASDLQVVDSLMGAYPGQAWRERLASVRDVTDVPPTLVEEIRALYLAQRLEGTLAAPTSSAARPRL